MIKFFRHIRRSLINQMGKPASPAGRYIKYAIGEILLVVIGILIALQVNNWNESRKENQEEISNLKSLKSELEVSLEELKSDYNATKLFHNSTLKIQSWMRNKTMFSDSMSRDFFLSYQIANFYPKTSTYETFKNGNLELIKSDSLKILITDIYEAGYKRLESKNNTTGNGVMKNYVRNHFRVTSTAKPDDNFRILRDSYSATPNDYTKLLDDPKYETLISESIFLRRIHIRDFEFTIKSVEEGILKIDNYLKIKL